MALVTAQLAALHDVLNKPVSFLKKKKYNKMVPGCGLDAAPSLPSAGFNEKHLSEPWMFTYVKYLLLYRLLYHGEKFSIKTPFQMKKLKIKEKLIADICVCV